MNIKISVAKNDVLDENDIFLLELTVYGCFGLIYVEPDFFSILGYPPKTISSPLPLGILLFLLRGWDVAADLG